MTSTPPSRPTQLRAVPPHPPSAGSQMTATTAPASSNSADQPQPEVISQHRGSRHRWLIAGGAVVGLGCLSLLPLTHRVNGPGEISATQDAFETISMPASGGSISAITVHANQSVSANTPVAILTLETLEDRLSQIQQQEVQAAAIVEGRRQEIARRQSDLREAQARETTAEQEVARLQAEVQGQVWPEAVGWHGEMAALRSEVSGLQQNLETIATQIDGVQFAVEQGALARRALEDLEVQQVQLRNQIAQRQGQIAAKGSQVEALAFSKETTLQQAIAQLTERRAHRHSVEQSVASAIAEYAAQAESLQAIEQETARLEQRLVEEEMLYTTIPGTVITPQQEIDALRGRYVEPGKPLLAIMNPEKLTVDMWVRQEDRDLISPGMTAEFRPQSGRWESYLAVVETVAAQAEFNEQEQKPMLRVTLRLEEADVLLQLNTTGTARIVTESMPIYRKIIREVLKVVPLQKLLAF